VKEELVKVLFTTQIAWTLYNKGKKDIGRLKSLLSVDLWFTTGKIFKFPSLIKLGY